MSELGTSVRTILLKNNDTGKLYIYIYINARTLSIDSYELVVFSTVFSSIEKMIACCGIAKTFVYRTMDDFALLVS